MIPELAEITNAVLPAASVETLKQLRNRACEATEFTPQSHQRFLRRVLSPDSPVRNLFMVHGTGTGKTCTAIQIAEEYILRPEFQDKKVLVVSSKAVQDNFRTQLFDMQRVKLDTTANILSSKQCTGRRYLDMLLRIESEPKNWNDPRIRDKLETTADKIIDEFYEFSGYTSFAKTINDRLTTDVEKNLEWAQETYGDRLLIIDEIHNMRESGDKKMSTKGLENLVKNVKGLVLVLLTATPMYDSYDEIIFYFNLFLWNDRKQANDKEMTVGEFFKADGTLKSGAPEERFRRMCQDYVSFVKGDNPFTFPFRLPPPVIADRSANTKNFLGKNIGDEERIKYISLVETQVKGYQKEVVTKGDRTDTEERRAALMVPTIAVLPEGKSYAETFVLDKKQYNYRDEPFLTEDKLENYSGKFASVIRSIRNSKGVVLVYSNYVEMGARLFAMALEEHGFSPARGSTLLVKPSKTGMGKYILLTSDYKTEDISKMLDLVKHPNNRNGEQVRVVITSPIVSEGIDFRYIRQVHILDPWWNMSRIEQVIGRGLRTCSHQLLPFEEQNCSVYLHVLRAEDKRELYDEYTYRTRVEAKAIKIAHVRKVLAESAMDCPLQITLNTLPNDWKNLEVEQTRSEKSEAVTYSLQSMMAPAFNDSPDVTECKVKPVPEEPEHLRPLSTYMDVRDEILNRLSILFAQKPIWERTDLFRALPEYAEDVVIYNLQTAISTAFRFKDNVGREAVLESKGNLYALAPLGVPNKTLVERTTKPPIRGEVDLVEPKEEEREVEVTIPEVTTDILAERRDEYVFPADATTRFSEEVLNGFIFDHTFTDAEKKAYLRSHPDKLPFASRLRIPDTDIFVLGNEATDPPEVIGEDKTKYQAWVDRLVASFIENRTKLYASLKKNSKGEVVFVTVKVEMKDDVLVRSMKDQTRYDLLACGSGDNLKHVQAYGKAIDREGVGVPDELKSNKHRCVYIELLAREEFNGMWLTPEEYSVLFDNKKARDTVAKAFKKKETA